MWGQASGQPGSREPLLQPQQRAKGEKLEVPGGFWGAGGVCGGVSWPGHPVPHHGTSQTAAAIPRGSESLPERRPRELERWGI